MCMLSVEMKNKVVAKTATMACRECSCGYGYSSVIVVDLANFLPLNVCAGFIIFFLNDKRLGKWSLKIPYLLWY